MSTSFSDQYGNAVSTIVSLSANANDNLKGVRDFFDQFDGRVPQYTPSMLGLLANTGMTLTSLTEGLEGLGEFQDSRARETADFLEAASNAIGVASGVVGLYGLAIIAIPALAPAAVVLTTASIGLSLLGFAINEFKEPILEIADQFDSNQNGNNDNPNGGPPLGAFGNPPISPLIIDQDGDGVETISLPNSSAYFDLNADGRAELTSWVGADDALLVLDRNANGRIDDITELFGSQTQDGFSQLAELDDNADGLIDARDSAYEDLRVWQDANGDGVSEEAELQTLQEANITSITSNAAEIDERNNGNAVTHRGTVTFGDGSQSDVDDVWFENNQALTSDIDANAALDPLVLRLPDLQGYGTFGSLHSAMSEDPALLNMVEQLVLTANTSSGSEFRDQVEAIVLAWTGANSIDPESRGRSIDAQHLSVLESIFARDYVQTAGSNATFSDPAPNAAHELEKQYENFIDQFTGRIAVQVLPSLVGYTQAGLTPAEDILNSPFLNLLLFSYDSFNNRVATFDSSAAFQNVVEGIPENSDDAIAYIELTGTLMRGILKDFSVNPQYSILYNDFDGINDLALRSYFLDLATGSNFIQGSDADDVLIADDPERDYFVRDLTGASSVLFGGEGNDTLTGENGGDLYLYRVGDGADVIDDQGSPDFFVGRDTFVSSPFPRGNEGGFDRLAIVGVDRDDAVFSKVGDDLIISFPDNPADSIQIVGQFADDAASIIEEVVFADMAMARTDIEFLFASPVLLVGGEGSQIVSGTAADETLDGGTGSDRFLFGPGSGSDTIAFASDNVSVNDVVSLAFLQSQTFFAMVGDDLVLRFFEETVGEDGTVERTILPDVLTIQDQRTRATIDKFIFADGEVADEADIAEQLSAGVVNIALDFDDVVLVRSGVADTAPFVGGSGPVFEGMDLVIQIDGVEVQRIGGQFISRLQGGEIPVNGADALIFLDGTVLTREQIAATVPLIGSEDTDAPVSGSALGTLFGSSEGETVLGLGGNDEIFAGAGDDTVIGGAGDDLIFGDSTTFGAGGGLSDGPGFGDPTVAPETVGSDTYRYASGDGNDTIVDNGAGGLDFDRLQLTDLMEADVAFTRVRSFETTDPFDNSGGGLLGGGGPGLFPPGPVAPPETAVDLILTVVATGETIRIANQFSDDLAGVESIEFADGSTVSRVDLSNTVALTDDETAPGLQELSGSGVIDAGGRYTYVRGTGDSDTALFGSESGSQIVYGVETLRFIDLDSSDLTVNREDADLVLSAGVDGPSVTVAGYFAVDGATTDYLGNPVNSTLTDIWFANGEIWDSNRIQAEAAVSGSELADDISGTSGFDLVEAGAGDDTVDGGEGNDVIDGQTGADVLVGGNGDDTFRTRDGDGNDTIDGGSGIDVYDASEMTEALAVDLGAGTAVAASGSDALTDIESVVGGTADDTLIGNDLSNTLDGSRGDDTVDGGAGDDLLIGGRGGDALDGGEGRDTAGYRAALSGISLSLEDGIGTRGDAIGDTFESIEDVLASNYSDEIVGSAVSNLLDLGNGDDTAFGGDGDDIILGGSGRDTLDGEMGDDSIVGGFGSDDLTGGVGDDSLSGGAGVDTVDGGAGSDTVIWSRGDGNDLLSDGGTSSGDIDVLALGGIARAGLMIGAFRTDIFLTTADGETVTLVGQVDGTGTSGFERIVFDDGSGYSRAELLDLAVEQENGIVLVLDTDDLETDRNVSLDIDTADLLSRAFDVDGDVLSISTFGSAMGGTVTFTTADTITFTPDAGFIGTATFDYTVVDGFGAEDTGTVTIKVLPSDVVVNSAPVLATPLSDVSSDEDTAVSFALPVDAFTDIDGDALTLAATLIDGSVLPAWLGFDGNAFTGTPPAEFNGTLEIAVTASDGELTSEASLFSLEIVAVNDAPMVAMPLSDVSSEEDAAVSFAVPVDAFTDIDGDALTLAATLADGSALPAWLTFDGSSFAGRPPNEFSGTVEIAVTAFDGELSSEVSLFSLEIMAVNDVPVIATPLENVSSPEDSAVIFAIPTETFTDAEGDALTLSAILTNGSALPQWLLFDGTTFTGIPPADFNGTLSIEVTATDGEGVSDASVFSLEFEAVNDAPVTVMPLADVSGREDTSLVFAIPLDAFADVDGDALARTATLANGEPLPDWLTFNGAVFRGTPPADFNGSLEIAVTASDGELSSSASLFSLDIQAVNDAPVVATPLANVSSGEDTAVSFALPADAFTDVDEDALTLTATLIDGSALPTWLSFDGSAFNGTPPADFNGTIEIAVTASDSELSSEASLFSLQILAINDAPVTSTPLANVSSDEDMAVSFALPADAFSDVDGDALTLAATLADGSALPAWLSFDGSAFTGTPPAEFNGALEIAVTASDGGLSSAASLFSLEIEAVNDAPVVAAPLANVSFNENEVIGFALPAGTFSDIDGDALTLTATLADGSVLPSWLSFDAAAGSFSGTAPTDAEGDLDIAITASDGALTAVDTFTLSIEVDDDTGTPGIDASGFAFSSVNDWYNPAWGGGFNVTYEYTVSEASIAGDDLFAWAIDSGYSGSGTVVQAWTSNFNGPVSTSNDGSFVIGNENVGYRPELEAGDSFSVSFQVQGAGFDPADFAPIFTDRDPEPVDVDESDVSIDASATNDWGSGFLQSVSIHNLASDTIEGWSVMLDVPDNDSFVFNSVWGAEAETLANGDILFSNLSWNENITAGGSVNFGFTGDNSTQLAVMIEDGDFAWL